MVSWFYKWRLWKKFEKPARRRRQARARTRPATLAPTLGLAGARHPAAMLAHALSPPWSPLAGPHFFCSPPRRPRHQSPLVGPRLGDCRGHARRGHARRAPGHRSAWPQSMLAKLPGTGARHAASCFRAYALSSRGRYARPGAGAGRARHAAASPRWGHAQGTPWFIFLMLCAIE